MEALASPLLEAVNDAIDPSPLMLRAGVTLLNAKLSATGRLRSDGGMTLEVNVTVSGGCAALKVSDAPAPRTSSVKLPLR